VILNKRAHVYYSGSVQGVGFRFTTERLASKLGLKGWVRNVEDGRVELVCEGEASDIDSLMAKISEIFGGYIRDVSVERSEASGEFEDFGVRS
jgi:acylphosphatase